MSKRKLYTLCCDQEPKLVKPKYVGLHKVFEPTDRILVCPACNDLYGGIYGESKLNYLLRKLRLV